MSDNENNQEPTLRDIMEHLKKQDKRTSRAVYLNGFAFGASIILVGLSLWIGNMVAISYAGNCVFLIIAGFAFISWCSYKQRKIKD